MRSLWTAVGVHTEWVHHHRQQTWRPDAHQYDSPTTVTPPVVDVFAAGGSAADLPVRRMWPTVGHRPKRTPLLLCVAPTGGAPEYAVDHGAGQLDQCGGGYRVRDDSHRHSLTILKTFDIIQQTGYFIAPGA